MRVAPAVLACGLFACGFTHGQLGGDARNGGDDAADAPGDVTASSDWWDPAWGFRVPITITNTSALALPAGYQVGVSYPFLSSPCTGVRDDVRIVYANTTELHRMFDNVSPVMWAWFPLAAPLASGATSTGEYWVYCGNPNAGPALQNPKLIFELFDTFGQATLDSTIWATTNTVAVSNGSLVVGGGQNTDNGVITATQTFPANRAVDFIASPATVNNAYFWAGFEGSTTNGAPYAIWWTYTAGTIGPSYRITTNSLDFRSPTPKTLDTTAHHFSVENYGTKAAFRYDNAIVETDTYDLPAPATFKVRLWNYQTSPLVSYDMVRVRRAVDPPPAVTLGSPQPKP